MAFDEVRMPADVDRGAKGGPAWSTLIIVTASGAEQRQANWSRARQVWEVGHSLKSLAQYDALVAFHWARQGRLRGFRLKDWSDFSSAIGGVETHHALQSLGGSHWQLQKGYASGGQTVYRTIAKPAGDNLADPAADGTSSTVRLFTAGGAAIPTGWTVDLTTGIVTYAGSQPYATFQYDVPVRFDEDAMHASIDEVTYRSWPGIRLVEIML